jgi:hypothetical protein
VKNVQRRLICGKRYNDSAKGMASRKRYNHTEKGRASVRRANRVQREKGRLARDNRTKKLGKLLNLSVNPSATEPERRLARQMYNKLKARDQVA